MKPPNRVLQDMKKLLDINAILLNAYGEPVEQPKVEKNKVLLTSGEWKSVKAVTTADDTVMEALKLGNAIILALDIASEKLEPKERVDRFLLSTRVAEAMKESQPLEIDRDDEKRIDAASELITGNHMFIARIREALHEAAPVDLKKRVNGRDEKKDAIAPH